MARFSGEGSEALLIHPGSGDQSLTLDGFLYSQVARLAGNLEYLQVPL